MARPAHIGGAADDQRTIIDGNPASETTMRARWPALSYPSPLLQAKDHLEAASKTHSFSDRSADSCMFRGHLPMIHSHFSSKSGPNRSRIGLRDREATLMGVFPTPPRRCTRKLFQDVGRRRTAGRVLVGRSHVLGSAATPMRQRNRENNRSNVSRESRPTGPWEQSFQGPCPFWGRGAAVTMGHAATRPARDANARRRAARSRIAAQPNVVRSDSRRLRNSPALGQRPSTSLTSRERTSSASSSGKSARSSRGSGDGV